MKEKIRVEIPLRLPSLNDYTRACRNNKFLGAKMKAEIEQTIGHYLSGLPTFEKTVKINFTWIESNYRRDLDNICFAKKFVLDALVKQGKLKNDNRKWVAGFTDSFDYGKKNKVILEIEEV